LATEGEPTEDGRMILPGALTWREPPLSALGLDFTGPGGHEGAKIAGRVDRIWREGNEVWGECVFNNNEFGLHIADLVEPKSLTGNAIDPAGATTEIWDRETMTPIGSDEELMQALMEGRELLTVFTRYVIGATTFCPVQAITDAKVMLASGVSMSFFTPSR